MASKVVCVKGMWVTADGTEREFPWESGSGKSDFCARNYGRVMFDKYARDCPYFDDMRDEDKANSYKTCCDCANAMRVKIKGE